MATSKYDNYPLEVLHNLYDRIDRKIYPEEAAEIRKAIINYDKRENPAKLSERLGAYILDSIIFSILYIASMLIIGHSNIVSFITDNLLISVVMIFIEIQIIFLLLNGWLLIKNGQTIGKKVFDIKIVTDDRNKPDFFHIYFLRYFLIFFISMTPFGIMLSSLDPLFILRRDRKCIHDHIAGTKVVKVVKEKNISETEIRSEPAT